MSTSAPRRGSRPRRTPASRPRRREQLARDPAAAKRKYDELYDSLEQFITFSNPDALAAATEAGLNNIQTLRDETLREAMTPHVPFGCLRPLISNEYYPTFNRDNVELISGGIRRITAEGVVSQDGTLREVDTLICATGYQVRKYLSAIEVTGRDGLAIADAWEGGARAYLGIMTAGFPNLFMMYGPNTNNGSILFMLETQADFIINQIEMMGRDRLAWIDVRREIMDDYNEALQRDLGQVGVWRGPAAATTTARPPAASSPNGRTPMTEYRKRCQAVDDERFERHRREPVEA